MTALLPPPGDQQQIAYVHQYVKRRVRLSVAWATIIAAVIGAGTIVVTTLLQRTSRDEFVGLVNTVQQQQVIIERLSKTVKVLRAAAPQLARHVFIEENALHVI